MFEAGDYPPMVPLTRFAVTLVLTGLLVSAGCIGVLTGQEPLLFGANPVAVSPAAQDDAGYEEDRRATQEISRSVSAAGQTREVQVTNHIAEYSRTVTVDPVGTAELARFVVVSTPAVDVLGRTFNPVGDMSNREIIELVQDEYQGLERVEPAGERSVRVLGSSTTVSTFTGEARFTGVDQTVELTIHVTRTRDGGDFIVAIAIHPTLLPGETSRVDAMLRGIQHGSN